MYNLIFGNLNFLKRNLMHKNQRIQLALKLKYDRKMTPKYGEQYIFLSEKLFEVHSAWWLFHTLARMNKNIWGWVKPRFLGFS